MRHCAQVVQMQVHMHVRNRLARVTPVLYAEFTAGRPVHAADDLLDGADGAPQIAPLFLG